MLRLQDQRTLNKAGGGQTTNTANEVMEKHVQTVSRLLLKMHNDHVRSRDKVHDKLFKENESLVRQLEILNSQVSASPLCLISHRTFLPALQLCQSSFFLHA